MYKNRRSQSVRQSRSQSSLLVTAGGSCVPPPQLPGLASHHWQRRRGGRRRRLDFLDLVKVGDHLPRDLRQELLGHLHMAAPPRRLPEGHKLQRRRAGGSAWCQGLLRESSGLHALATHASAPPCTAAWQLQAEPLRMYHPPAQCRAPPCARPPAAPSCPSPAPAGQPSIKREH